MITPIVMIIILGGCFMAIALNLAADNRIKNSVMRAAIIIAIATGAVFYGYGYAYCNGFSAESLFRALLAMCRMLAGINDYSGIQSCPLLTNSLGKTIFWMGHFCGFYVTASAAVTILGEKLLRRIKTTLLRKGPLLLIYGVNEASVSYGKDMIEKKKRAVLFVDPDGNTPFESTIKAMGAVMEKSEKAVVPMEGFLKYINFAPGSRRLELAAMHSDGRKNLKYAEKLLDLMSRAGIDPDQTSLIISSTGSRSASLQADNSKGYSSVFSYDEYDLTARLLIRDHPPCERIRFDGHGKALEDLHIVILGYGRMGRAVLSQFLCNGQFFGSSFRADIFDPGPQNGFLYGHKLTEEYNIHFHKADGKTEEFYRFLEENADSIKCVVICTGNSGDNREISEDLVSWYGFGRRMPMIIQTAKGCYYTMDESGCTSECSNIYRSDVLDIRKTDAMAMQIHHMYTGSGEDALSDWKKCSYFNRLSSRASADFYPAMLYAAGRTQEQVIKGEWPPDDGTLENLAVTEHLRWCAFHHVHGIETMPDEVYRQRAAAYTEEKRKKGSSSIKIGKDMDNHMHACLIPWDDLDALSERENMITGGNVDYKQMDRNNVLALSKVLEAMNKAAEEDAND